MTFLNLLRRSLFASFGVRLVCVAVDLIVAMLLAELLHGLVFDPLGLLPGDHSTTVVVVLYLYFMVSWLSPLQATPVQFLAGLRIVSKTGGRLTLARAAMRGVVLVVLIFVTMTLPGYPEWPALLAFWVLGLVLVFLAALTPNRQAFHDLLAHSIVVNRRALSDPDLRQQLLEHLADSDPASRRRRRPDAWSIAVNLVVLCFPAALLLSISHVQYDRNMSYRTHYAVQETAALRLAVERYHRENGRWPASDVREADLGAAGRHAYPDGGRYELEEDGSIRIRFEISPALTKGSIVLVPEATEAGYAWLCRHEGAIAQNYLPAMCRDQ